MAQPLTVTNLTKRYGRFVAVDGVSFAVAPGTITGLLGPNGSGKSSILHSLTGVVTPTSGSIAIAGNPHSSTAAKAALGFVPDDLALPLNLTGYEYLDLVRRLQPRSDLELAHELAHLLAIDAALGRLVAEYSHGMKRKIQTIAALLHRPTLLVLDEPFRGLDPEAHMVLRHLIASFVDDGGGVLVATHDLAAAETYCDTVTIVADGTVVAQGVAAGLLAEYDEPTLEGVFLAATGLGTRARAARDLIAGLRLAGSDHPGAAVASGSVHQGG